MYLFLNIVTISGRAACLPKIGVNVIWPQKCELELSAKRSSWELVVRVQYSIQYEYYPLIHYCITFIRVIFSYEVYFNIFVQVKLEYEYISISVCRHEYLVRTDYRRSNQEPIGRRARPSRRCATVRTAAGACTEPASGSRGVRSFARGLLHAATASTQSKVHLIKRLGFVYRSRRALVRFLAARLRIQYCISFRLGLRLGAHRRSPARGEQLRRARRAALRNACESHGGRRSRPSGLLVALATCGGVRADTCRVPPLAQDSLSIAHYFSQLVSFKYNNYDSTR